MEKIKLIKKLVPFLILAMMLTMSPITYAQEDEREEPTKAEEQPTTQITSQANRQNITERTVNPSALNVRSQPWMGNNIINHVNRGDRVGVIAENNGWCRIQYVTRTNGTRTDFNNAYVACNYLNGNGGGTPSGGEAFGGPEITTSAERTINTAALNVRSQPWMSNNIINHVNQGDRVGVIAENNGWCRIQYVTRTNGTRTDFNNAYVACRFLNGGGTPSGGEAFGGPEITTSAERTVSTAALNVRSQPWMGNNIINHVNRGDRVGVITQNNGWCRIQHVTRTNGTRTNFNNAYVSCNYLR